MITFSCAGKNFVFRNPILGNTDELSFQRVNRLTRGGDIIIFRDAEWPKTETFNLTFDFDRDVDYQLMLYFLKYSLGLNVQYIDFEGQVWNGFIQNPEVAGQQSGLNSYQVNLIYEVA